MGCVCVEVEMYLDVTTVPAKQQALLHIEEYGYRLIIINI